MKKRFAFLLLSVFALSALSGCRLDSPGGNEPEEEYDPAKDVLMVKREFFQKYQKPVAEITLTVEKQTEEHMRGKVMFEGEESAAEKTFLAAKNEQNSWEIVFDGEGAVPCGTAEEHDFPKDMMSDCVE